MPRFAAAVALALATWSCSVTAPAPDADWTLYKLEFVSPEGRIIDTGNARISHSEGQGIGLLLAAHYDDQPAFVSIWQWTRDNLQIRGDKLVAWKWVPAAIAEESRGEVSDRNNATDGDLFIAWALHRAGRKWNEQSYLQAGSEITRDIRAKLLRPSPQGLLLLPGEQGFVKPEGVTVNLSYWVFPALRELDQLDPAPEWGQLIQSGSALLQTGRFGRWQLPPDWLRLAGKPEIAPGFNPRFGYEAVRIPLYLVWARLDSPENLRAFAEFWEYFHSARFTPAWTSLADDSVDSHDASPGIKAVASLTRSRAASRFWYEPDLPALAAGQDYYSASLLLLAKLAARESAPR